MTSTPSTPAGLEKWLVFAAITLAFFFLNLSTFTSVGVVLYTMIGELHWSQTEGYFSFSLLGLACGLSSPLPTMVMRWKGCRTAMCLGAGVLLAGFIVAAYAQSLIAFYVAMVLLGIGFSLAGNVPGVFLIAAWFPRSSSRMIGYYLMLGALGAVLGPPIVEVLVRTTGWRGNWQAMAGFAAVVGFVCLAFVRDRKTERPDPIDSPSTDVAVSSWTERAAIATPQFLLVAVAMVLNLFGVTTLSSIGFAHLVNLGATQVTAALVLSVMAITATAVKGVTGRLCEHLPPKYLLSVGLVLQAAGCALLVVADNTNLQFAAPATFGVGWGLTYVAGTVLLLDYFGAETGARVLAVVWFLTSIAAAGPTVAGMIFDRHQTYGPIFLAYAVAMVLLAVPLVAMRAPKAPA